MKSFWKFKIDNSYKKLLMVIAVPIILFLLLWLPIVLSAAYHRHIAKDQVEKSIAELKIPGELVKDVTRDNGCISFSGSGFAPSGLRCSYASGKFYLADTNVNEYIQSIQKQLDEAGYDSYTPVPISNEWIEENLNNRKNDIVIIYRQENTRELFVLHVYNKSSRSYPNEYLMTDLSDELRSNLQSEEDYIIGISNSYTYRCNIDSLFVELKLFPCSS